MPCHVMEMNRQIYFPSEKHRAPVADLPVLVFDGKIQSSSTMLGSEHRAHYRTSGPRATLMKSISDGLVRDIHGSGMLEVILWGSGSAHPVTPRKKKEQVPLLLMR